MVTPELRFRPSPNSVINVSLSGDDQEVEDEEDDGDEDDDEKDPEDEDDADTCL
jgi:hypothetical protein